MVVHSWSDTDWAHASLRNSCVVIWFVPRGLGLRSLMRAVHCRGRVFVGYQLLRCYCSAMCGRLEAVPYRPVVSEVSFVSLMPYICGVYRIYAACYQSCSGFYCAWYVVNRCLCTLPTGRWGAAVICGTCAGCVFVGLRDAGATIKDICVGAEAAEQLRGVHLQSTLGSDCRIFFCV